MSRDILKELTEVLEGRKLYEAGSSYVASLYAEGLDKILEKCGEEAVEMIVAAKNGDPDQIVRETADLWFHTMIMLAERGLTAEDVLAELARRFGVSGHDEKASRSQPDSNKD